MNIIDMILHAIGPVWVVIILVWLHFLADFVFQSNWMATQKSSNNWALSWHILVYSSFFILIGFKYAVVNGLIHMVVDYITSRINSKLWAEKRIHEFFVCVGCDQAIHITSLILTAKYMIHAI